MDQYKAWDRAGSKSPPKLEHRCRTTSVIENTMILWYYNIKQNTHTYCKVCICMYIHVFLYIEFSSLNYPFIYIYTRSIGYIYIYTYIYIYPGISQGLANGGLWTKSLIWYKGLQTTPKSSHISIGSTLNDCFNKFQYCSNRTPATALLEVIYTYFYYTGSWALLIVHKTLQIRIILFCFAIPYPAQPKNCHFCWRTLSTLYLSLSTPFSSLSTAFEGFLMLVPWLFHRSSLLGCCFFSSATYYPLFPQKIMK